MKFYLKLNVLLYLYMSVLTDTYTHILSLTLTYIHTHAHTFTHAQLAMLRSETSDKAKVCYMCVTAQFETFDRLEL